MSDKLGINPWVAILKKPKSTIKAIIGYNPNHRLFLLSFIYGLSIVFSTMQNWELGERMGLFPILITAIVIAPLVGYLLLSLGSWFVFHVGRWLGGKGNFLEVRASMAWSHVPTIANIFLWIILILIFQNVIFQSIEFKPFLGRMNLGILIFIYLLQLVAFIWTLVIYVNSLASVNDFSILKSIGTILVSSFLISLIYFIFVVLFRWTCSAFFDQPVLTNFF